MAMMPRVKAIFLRRSGVRKTRAMALNKGISSSGRAVPAGRDRGHRLPEYGNRGRHRIPNDSG
ncbi:hypothetical protein GCM10017591_03500 [Microbacterium dextranolyticum]|uniref:Uncharacterized protein n=1 Tax=Microbacterium dextranolyticum TaxID=36806 RepID=A0A9W6M4G9_9MICO|nr:hypothetical protein GCM10017591_03500 [Microbacterium dextranolyticum]